MLLIVFLNQFFMRRLFLCFTAFALPAIAFAQKDTLRIMAYNVLYYGNGCQGANANYHQYLNTIVGYTRPDVLSLEKAASIPTSDTDKFATAPKGFIDSILKYALTTPSHINYAYCPFTNNALANNMCLLFYNTQKLGYCGMIANYVNVTDFNTYRLYYKDPNLAQTHDTTFLYITQNHDKSGDEFEQVRYHQIMGEVNDLKNHFTHWGNHLNLGDFNVRTSKERFYALLTDTKDTNFVFYDPPFYPEKKLKYPANWDKDPIYAAYFTTSTRESAFVPNSCGSGGGGKNWYDHIFISPWLVNNANYMRYIPGSYRTIGNDGQRFRVSIINKNVHENTSAPANVIEALYQMSNKYPVMVDLEVTQNTTGNSLPDPEIAGIEAFTTEVVKIELNKDNKLSVQFPEAMKGQEITITVTNKVTREDEISEHFTLKNTEKIINCHKLDKGIYGVKVAGKHNLITKAEITLE
ncbi:MAG: hypothetical protein EBX41_02110 [Chitinophagia bacterium]|nr:hypothetical protein [Chitinophagia bacterium]